MKVAPLALTMADWKPSAFRVTLAPPTPPQPTPAESTLRTAAIPPNSAVYPGCVPTVKTVLS